MLKNPHSMPGLKTFQSIQKLAITHSKEKKSVLVVDNEKKASFITRILKTAATQPEISFQPASSVDADAIKRTQAYLTKVVQTAINEVAADAKLTQDQSLLLACKADEKLKVATTFSPKALNTCLNGISDDMITFANKVLPASASEREAPRAPTELLIHLLALVETSTCPEAIAFQESAKDFWMSGGVDVSNVKMLIDTLLQEKWLSRDEALCQQVKRLASQLPDPKSQIPLTRLHDNPYGRVFDSLFVGSLIDNPPQKALNTSHQMAQGLADILSAIGQEKAMTAARITRCLVNNDLRFWCEEDSLLMSFAKTQDGLSALEKLNQILKTPPKNGIDIVMLQYLSAKLSVALKDADANSNSISWMVNAHDNYEKFIVPEANRRDEPNTGLNINNIVPCAGITLPYQPSVLMGSWMVASQRPVMLNRPHLETLSHTTKAALENSAPFVSGVSGSTNILLYLGAHLKEIGYPIDPKHLLMSAMMFVNYDGGHSVHEVLWPAHQVDKKLGLALELDNGLDHLQFIGTHHHLEKMFENSSSKNAIRQAQAAAWEGTLDYFRKYSFYRNETLQ